MSRLHTKATHNGRCGCIGYTQRQEMWMSRVHIVAGDVDV